MRPASSARSPPTRTDFPVLRGLPPAKQDVRFPDLRFWCKHISASGIRERFVAEKVAKRENLCNKGEKSESENESENIVTLC